MVEVLPVFMVLDVEPLFIVPEVLLVPEVFMVLEVPEVLLLFILVPEVEPSVLLVPD